MGSNLYKRALKSCLRMLVLLLLGLSLFGGWLYWQAPELDTIQPGFEKVMKERLKVKELSLGQLSWDWRDFLWLKSTHLDFTSGDGAIAFHEGGIAIGIKLTTLLTGNFVPDRIRLIGGRLDIQHTESGHDFPAAQLILDDVELNWRYRDEWSGTLHHLHLMLDGQNRELEMTSSELALSASLGDDLLPDSIEAKCEGLRWLPEPLQPLFDGDAASSVDLTRTNRRTWKVDASIKSDQAFTLLPDTIYSVQLDRAKGKLALKMEDSETLTLHSIKLEQLYWALDKSTIEAEGGWSAGLLTMRAKSESLSMPVMWSWLRPLGDEEWHEWLTLMKNGTASQATAKASLVWDNPLKSLPSDKNWEAMLFQVSAHVENSDIALGISEDFLRRGTAQVELNQDGLNATIIDAELPHNLGRTSGELYIPWQSLNLHISGNIKVDVAQLLAWSGPQEMASWQWNHAAASGSFQMVWDPSKPEPEKATATLHPQGEWRISAHGIEAALSDGKATWDQSRGLSITGTRFHGAHIDGGFNLEAITDEQQWRLTKLDMRSTSDFALLAAHFQLPLAEANGKVVNQLIFDGKWHGNIDMKEAGWHHFLGSSKKTGEPYTIHFDGKVDEQKESISLTNLTSSGKGLLIQNGSAAISSNHLDIGLNNLSTPSFHGSLNINIPFTDAPWELTVDADYLNRTALPESLNYQADMMNKSWLLSANIKRFDWDGSHMQGVFIRLPSKKGSIGQLKAKHIQTSQVNIADIDSSFSLPGGGHIDLRHLSAVAEGQHLTMSGTLKPEKAGGMRWQGFAELEGEFAQLLKVGKLSERFTGGGCHLLFSGSGVILHEQPWWQGLSGRLRLRTDNGHILEGGTMTTLLAATNLLQLPKLPLFLLGQREDLTEPGIMYERLQLEATLENQNISIRNVAMRSPAFDLIGKGSMNIETTETDLYLVVRPLQNLDSLLAKIPLLRDILGGRSHSFMRRVYHMHGPFRDAKVEVTRPEEAGLASAGLIEALLTLPDRWFSSIKEGVAPQQAAPAQ